MEPYQILNFLLQFGLDPGFWWAWESVIIFVWWINKVTKGVGSNKYVILQWTGNHWHKVKEMWVKKGAEVWGSKKSRMNQADAVLYTESGMMTDHGVIFTDLKHALPMKGLISSSEAKGFEMEIGIVDHNPGGKGISYSINPSVRDMEDFTGRHTIRDIVKSNAVGHPELLMLVLVGAVGFFGGVITGPFIPHGVSGGPVP